MAPVSSKPIRVGVDFGFVHDPTTVVVVEPFLEEDWEGMKSEPFVCFRVRRAERLSLNLTAQEVVDRITEIVAKLRRKLYRVEVFCDATGVGQAVKDFLAPAIRREGAYLVPVVITSGETERYEKGTRYIPKASLVQRLAVLFSQERIVIPSEETELVRELENFRRLVSDTTRKPKYEAAPGEYDDLVIALALAVWKDLSWKEVIGFLPVRIGL